MAKRRFDPEGVELLKLFDILSFDQLIKSAK